MPEIVLRFANMDKIQAAFKKAPQLAADEMGAAIQRVAAQIESDAVKFAPVNKQSGGGNLRQSIHSHPLGKLSAIVEVTAKYAVYVHEGTNPHIINVVNKKVLADRRRGIIFGKSVMHPGTKPNPFLQKAVDANERWINDRLMEVATNIFKKMF